MAGRRAVAEVNPDVRIAPFVIGLLAAKLTAQRPYLCSADPFEARYRDMILGPRSRCSSSVAAVYRATAVLRLHQLNICRRQFIPKLNLHRANDVRGRKGFDIFTVRPLGVFPKGGKIKVVEYLRHGGDAHSTVTDFARLRGWSTSVPFATAT